MPNRLEVELNADFRPEKRPAVTTGKVSFSFEPGSKKFVHNVQTIGTSEEAVDVGDVGTVGLVIIKNVGDTNYVEVGLTGSYTVKILPGHTAVLQPAGTLYAIANSAAVDIETYVFPAAS